MVTFSRSLSKEKERTERSVTLSKICFNLRSQKIGEGVEVGYKPRTHKFRIKRFAKVSKSNYLFGERDWDLHFLTITTNRIINNLVRARDSCCNKNGEIRRNFSLTFMKTDAHKVAGMKERHVLIRPPHDD